MTIATDVADLFGLPSRRAGIRPRREARPRPLVAIAVIAALAACSGGSKTAAPTTTSTSITTTTTLVTTTSTAPRSTTTTSPPPATMPSGDPVFDGFPHLVSIGDVDRRVANWYKDTPSGQLVALAPGVYTPYNPNVPDLVSYLKGPNSGDCAARSRYFPNAGGACWEGVA